MTPRPLDEQVQHEVETDGEQEVCGSAECGLAMA